MVALKYVHTGKLHNTKKKLKIQIFIAHRWSKRSAFLLQKNRFIGIVNTEENVIYKHTVS